ncbi:MAG: redoxin domain-containing protein [Gemmatimonadaceae bacterium]|jgi:cytochrome c biogenesis protein CcmG/thiol:disulfide interchange protein DsbE|nr:redoxin domain-containing protein [Gemmatimonadaceae bacterium]MCC6429978.1 redoxin domain-containing protein [Gemmatimonadaceae bacterium]
MNWKRAFYTTAAIGAPFIALLAFGMTRDPRSIPSPLPGRPAPVFDRAVFAPGADSLLRLTVGDTVRLAAHRGQVVVVNFWASWCLACRDEHLDLSQVASQFAGKGVKFYGLLYNDQEENGTRWIADMGGQAYPALSDPGARTAIDYGLYGVPETFVIDQRGVVAHKYIGPVRADSMSRLLDSLLTATPTPADTPVRRALPTPGATP